MLTLFKTLDSIIHGSCTSNDRIVNTLYYYQRALKEHPRDVKLLFATGHVYCKLGRYEMALEYLNKCIVIRKKQPDPEPAWPITLGWLYFLKGHVLRIMDRFVDAEYYLKKALPKELNNGNEILSLFVKINQGYIQKRLGKYKESLESFNNCANFLENKNYKCPGQRISPYGRKHCEKCRIPIECYYAVKEYITYYIALNKWELAGHQDNEGKILSLVQTCMDMHTFYSPEKNKYVIELKQNILAASGAQTDPFGDISRDIQSESSCELNTGITKRESDDILHKSEIFRLLGITVAAKDFLLKLVHTPFSHYANFYIGCILRQESKCTEAHEYFRKCLHTQPGDPNIQYNIAETYRRNGRYKEALVLYDVCLNKNPADREVWLKKASVLSELCEYSKALQYYEKYETEIKEQFKDLLKDYTKLHPVYNEFFTRNKAYVAYGQGKYIEALKYADASLKCNLNNEYAIITKVQSIIGICERIHQSGKEGSTTPLLNEEYRLYPLKNQKGNWYAIVHHENTVRHLYKYDIPGNVTCQFETLKNESYQKVRKYLLNTYTTSPNDLINKY